MNAARQSMNSPVNSPPAPRDVLAWLLAAVAELLTVPHAQLDPAVRFRELGLGSAQLTLLAARLAERYGCALAPTAPWQYPTPRALAQHVAEKLAPGATPEPTAAAAPRARGEHLSAPIALVGIGCRLPGGVGSPEEFWTLLCEGRSAIREVPKERWDADAWVDADPDAPGKMNTRWGGFLEAIDTFDAAFFGISPKEARQMDPQQRLSLELAWEALEDAGINPAALRGREVGVFLGAMGSDYVRLIAGDASAIESHTATGQDTSIISARISYALGLQGSSLTVNTACSSSLVALHLACQSLRLGEVTTALVGGVHLMASPESTVAMTRFGALNPAGQCRAFDADASGYVRGEGGGVVVLKPLHHALADGDRIYCLILGSATNNDGFSNGLTAPNPAAQEAVLRAACARAGVQPTTIQYVEAHGPGTALGDPIEAGALGAVLGRDRDPKRPLRIGSVKTNLGHLEAAAGVTGLIKVALALHYGALPASLHFERPNPRIPFAALGLKVQTALERWPPGSEPARAGVSAFGFGGTNCHVVLEAAPRSRALLLPLAAETPLALRRRTLAALDLVTQCAGWEEAAALCRALAAHAQGSCRAVAQGRSPEELVAALTRLLSEAPAPRAPARRRLVLVCPGQGAQWLGMGRSLLAQEPVFADEIAACDRIVRARHGWSIVAELLADERRSRLSEVDVLQPVLFAIQVALGALWRSFGLSPEAVVGHSQGEVAAAFLAGVLSLDDALRVVCERSRLAREHASGRGGMMMVPVDPGTPALDALASACGLFVAGFNSPRSVVLAGSLDALARAEAQLLQQGVQPQRVAIDYASHSPHVEPLLAPLQERLGGLSPRPARVRFRSTVEEAWLQGPECQAAYWARNLRAPVRFRQAIETLASEAPTVFLELSPHPVLLKSIEQTLAAMKSESSALPSCWRNEDERAGLLGSLAALFSLGLLPRWAAALPTAPPLAMLAPALHASLVAAFPADAGEESPAADPSPALPFLLSGKDEASLRAQAARLHGHLVAHPELAVADVARSLATTRAHLEVRAAVVARTRAELLPRLAALCGVGPVASARPGEARLALLFTGQGSQRAGMGRELATSFPAFREALDEVVAGFAAHLPRSLREVMFAEEGSDAAALLAQTAFTQPALFALEVALYRLGESFGLRPELLLGHSIGELAAAYVAGVFSLSDACALVAARGRLMQDLPPGGVMVSLEASEAELLPLLLDRAGELDLAALNGPWSTVISGEEDVVFAVARAMEARGRKATRLGVSHAFHSPRMEPMLAELRRLACRLRFRPPQIQIVSSVTGRRASAEELCSPDYWVKQARQPVRFLDAMRVLGSEGITTYLELGPQGVLAALGQECLSQDVRESAAFLPALRRDGSEAAALVTAMGGLHVRGHALDWAAYFATSGARRVTLPTYPFQRQRYWLSATPRSSARAAEETAEAMLRRLLGQGALSAAARAALPEILTALSTGRDAVARADVAGWFHQLQWRPVSLGVAHGDGAWLILDAADGGDAAAVATALRRCGGTVATRSLTADADPAAGDDLLSGALRGVVFLAGSGAGAPARFLKVLRRLAEHRADTPALWVVTRGAQAVAPTDGAPDPGQAALWGIGRILTLELPRLWGGMLDLPPSGLDDALARSVAAALAGTHGEEQLALRAEGAASLRLVPRPAPRRAAPRWSTSGTALVTGGLGAVGLRLARWLAQSGVRSLLLTGRRGLATPGIADAVAELRALGAEVRVVAADVADREAMTRALAEIPARAPLRAVFHLAGVADTAPLPDLNGDRLDAVMRAKVTGADVLLELIRDLPLDAFVAFSAVAWVWGAGSEGLSAAADAALEARMAAARAAGVPAITVAWGPWSEVTDAATAQRLGRRGLRALPPEDALDALSLALAERAARVVVADVDWARFRATLEVWGRRSLLAELPGGTDRGGHGSIRAELARLPPAERGHRLRQWLSAQCAVVMGYAEPAALDPQRDFFALGMESLMVADLRRRLLSGVGLHVSIGTIFKHATLDALARHLIDRLASCEPEVRPESTA